MTPGSVEADIPGEVRRRTYLASCRPTISPKRGTDDSLPEKFRFAFDASHPFYTGCGCPLLFFTVVLGQDFARLFGGGEKARQERFGADRPFLNLAQSVLRRLRVILFWRNLGCAA